MVGAASKLAYDLLRPPGMLPPNIGDLAPDFVLPTTDESDRRLFDLRDAPVILVFHEAGWDPARAEQVESHRHLVTTPSDAPARPVLLANDGEVAAAYGVTNGSGVFVIYPRWLVAGRHVSG